METKPPETAAASREPVEFPGGFSLVEVVIALGIVSFVLVALLGITAVGTTAGMESKWDTEGGQIFEQIMGQLHTKPFSESQAGSTNDPKLFPLPPLNVDAEENFYLDNQNNVVPATAATRKIRISARDPVALPYLNAQGEAQAVPKHDTLALVTVEIAPYPARAANATSVYFAEICRLQQ